VGWGMDWINMAQNLLTSWETVSFSRRSLFLTVSKFSLANTCISYSLRSFLKLSCNTILRLQTGLFLKVFRIKFHIQLLFTRACFMSHPIGSPSNLLNMLREDHNLLSFSLSNFVHPPVIFSY
jgi:hypothetical protein